MVTQLTPKVYTPKEYLELELEAEVRHEFINGKVLPMAGGTTQHNELVTNLCVLLKPTLRQQGRRLYSENVRLWIPSVNVFTYPDVMILEGEPVYHEESQTTVTNPVVIIEVLSDSTRDYDQGRKFRFYRSLETLREYVLVDQDRYAVMVYRRGNAKEWSLHILEDLSEVVQLDSVGIEMNLQAIYEGI
jgi:Uma2 family endonuclease